MSINKDLAIELRHDLHKHAELSLEEHYTKAKLEEFITSNTDLEVVDMGRWFYAVKRGKNSELSPVVLRADFDGICMEETCDIPYVSENKGVAHKCGHDGHSAVLAYLALELQNMEVEKDVYLIFQHGEEIGAGGKECADYVDTLKPSYVWAFHNRSGYEKNMVVYRDGLTQCASKGLIIRFTGAPAHASQPEDGINPAVPMSKLVTYSQEVLDKGLFKEMVLGTIINVDIGTKNFGIAASKGELDITIRANVEDEMLMYEKLLKDEAIRLGKEYGTSVDFSEEDPFPETRNHEEAIDVLLKACKELKLDTYKMIEPWRASEDFGYYLKNNKGAMVYVGNGVDYPNVHTSDYDFNDAIMDTVVSLFKELIKLS